MPIKIRCANATCQKALSVKDEFAGKRVKCPGCGQSILVPVQNVDSSPWNASPEPSSTAETKQTESHSAKTPSRRKRWPWIAVAVVALLSLGAGAAVYSGVLASIGVFGSIGATGPLVWKNADMAKFTLVITEDNASDQPQVFADRDFAGDVKKNLSARMVAVSEAKWELARLLDELEVRKKDQGLEVAIYLSAKHEADNWPKDGPTLNCGIWGLRMPKGFFFYDLKLNGQRQQDGAFQGKASGRVQLVKNNWIVFRDADFQLQPWTVVEDKASSAEKKEKVDSNKLQEK